MVKFGAASLMFSGCMISQGVGYICRIDSRIYANLHTNILQDVFLAIVVFYGLDLAGLIFQQENDHKHNSQKASEWLKQDNINVLKWYAQSPDLNLIEICSNPSSGSSMNTRSLLLVCMSFGTRRFVEI